MRKSETIEKTRRMLRVMHRSEATEKIYISWISQYINYLKENSNLKLVTSEKKMEAFLTYLAIDRKVSASTQNQAFNAILFLYRNVVEVKLEDKINAVRAKRSKRLPSVLTQNEVQSLLDVMNGTIEIVNEAINDKEDLM